MQMDQDTDRDREAADQAEPTESGEPQAQQDDDVVALQAKLSNLETEAAEFKDRYLRAAADLENIKRRADKDREDLLKFGNEKLLHELLPVLDSFDKALEASSGNGDQDESVEAGVKMVFKQLVDTLGRFGLAAVEAKDEPFDPNVHQAIQRIEEDDCSEEVVRDVFAKGYTLHGRLLRPAMVSVKVPKA